MARRHRSYRLEFKRHMAQQYLSAEFLLARLARQHDMCRSLIRIWVAKYEAGEFDDEQVQGDCLLLLDVLVKNCRPRSVGDYRNGVFVALPTQLQPAAIAPAGAERASPSYRQVSPDNYSPESG